MVMLDRSQYSLSTEAGYLRRSAIRELLAHAVDPKMVSLAGGLPPDELLPLEQYRSCLEAVLRRDGAASLQYSPPYEPLRAWLAEEMGRRGVVCAPEDIYITNGNQNGLAILSRLFLNPGDTAAVEAITYTGVKLVTAGRGVLVRAVATSAAHGVDIAGLEAAFAEEPRPRFAALIPDFHNPLGVSMSAEARRAAAALAGRYGVPLVEDDPYSALRFAGEAAPPLKAFDAAGYVFYLGSFSKMLAPALRLGWMVVPTALGEKVAGLRESLDLESSSLTQRAVYEFAVRGYLAEHVARLREALRERAEALLGALEAHLGAVATWTRPQGGMFVWLTLPPHIDTWELLPQALEAGVVYVPGRAFAVGDGARHMMRLNFSQLPPQRIIEGIERLAKTVKRYV